MSGGRNQTGTLSCFNLTRYRENVRKCAAAALYSRWAVSATPHSGRGLRANPESNGGAFEGFGGHFMP
jgi:hypothetical protein